MTRVGSATSRGASVINIYRYLFSGVRTQSSCPDSAYPPIGRLRLKANNSKLSTTQRPSQPILLEEAFTVPPSRPLRLARGSSHKGPDLQRLLERFEEQLDL